MNIGIDHGYYAIKTRHCSFPAGLTAYGSHEPYTRQGLLEFGGCFFVCGTGRQPIQRDKTINDNYYLLTLAALAREIRSRGALTECTVRIAAGLPLTSYGRDKPKFRSYLFRPSQPVQFRYEGVEYSITIADVQLFPQGFAALMAEPDLLTDEPSLLLMDIGGWTVDLMRIDNALPVAETAHSLELGMIRCIDEVRERVRQETGLYCATCGRRMTSSNPGKGAKREKAEYICYMGANHRNNCTGQRSYVAKRVEDIVLQATRLLLDTIKDTPRDESVEARVQAEMKELKYELRKTQQQVEEAAKEQEGLEMEVSRCLLGKSNFTTAMLSRLIDDKARERRELENKALDLERRIKNETEMSEKVAEYYNRFLGWSMEFGLATIERKRIIISQLYKRIELGRGYVVNFEVDWNYKQFIDTLELEQHMGITEVGIPMPPKVRKRSTQNSNRKNNGAA